MTPSDVRDRLVEALRLDLIGPGPEDAAYQAEVLDTAPSQQYLGGFLVPMDAADWQRGSTDLDDQLDVFLAPDGPEDDQPPEAQAGSHKNFFPSSLGLSFLCPKETTTLEVAVTWGDYRPNKGAASSPAKASDADDLSSETIEFALSPRWSTKAEYMHYDLGSSSFAVDNGNRVRADASGDVVRIGVNYHLK